MELLTNALIALSVKAFIFGKALPLIQQLVTSF